MWLKTTIKWRSKQHHSSLPQATPQAYIPYEYLSMPKEDDDQQYYATYKRPPDTNKDVAARIGKLSPMAACLDEALSELMQEHIRSSSTREEEDNPDRSQAEKSTTSNQNDNSDAGEDQVVIDEEFKNKIMNKFGQAMSNAFTMPSKPTTDPEPPAGILHGKIKYYNRYGGQWRIVVSDAEIRPRINIPYPQLKKQEVISLKEFSRRHMEREIHYKRRRVERGEGLPSMERDGVVKIDGDLMILAYDDKT